MSERAVRLHESPWQGVFYVTGGGTLLLSELLTTPGASATVLDARVPYAAAALAEQPDMALTDDAGRHRLAVLVLEFDAEGSVVPAAADAAVDLARLEDESAPGAQRHHLVHGSGTTRGRLGSRM